MPVPSPDERSRLYDIFGPLGWIARDMAGAVGCAESTVTDDLSSRGGLKNGFLVRPKTECGIYAATFAYYVKGEFPNARAQEITERILEIRRLESIAEGMELGLRALRTRHIPRELKGYVELLTLIFAREHTPSSIDLRKDPHLLWKQYLEDVRSERIAVPDSTEQVIEALSERFRANSERLQIALPLPSGLPEAMNAVLRKLRDADQMFLARRFGFGSETNPISPKDLGEETQEARVVIGARQYKIITRIVEGGLVERWLDPYRPRTLGDALRAEVHLEDRGDLTSLLSTRFSSIDISVLLQTALERERIEFIWQIIENNEAELRKKGFAPKAITEVKGILTKLSPQLELGMTIPAEIRDRLPTT